MMRPEIALDPLEVEVAGLNRRLGAAAPEDLLRSVLDEFPGRIALVSSFGAESVVLLHMLSRVDSAVPVLFLDTEMLFPETLAYQRRLATDLGLTGIRVVRPDPRDLAESDPEGRLHARDPDLCCALRKTRPLESALAGFDAWITGRKQHQTRARGNLPTFEPDAGERIKINPLSAWSRADVLSYITAHDLPRHPLIARGYPSIGCAPCTSRVAPGEDPRAGRWRGLAKEECGIHFVGGRAVRAANAEGNT